jgi:anti-sigma B factor antagonist
MSFEVYLGTGERTTTVYLSGDLDIASAPLLQSVLARALTPDTERLVLDMHEVEYMSSAGLRCLIVAHQNAGADVEIVLVGARSEVVDIIRLAGFDQAVTISPGLV